MPDSAQDRDGAADPSAAFTRRFFLKGAGGLAAGGALVGAPVGQEQQASEPVRLRSAFDLELSINGQKRTVAVEPRTTLLGALRVHLDPPLTGAKEVCDRGSCGACTVLVDGQPVYACMQLAADCAGKEVTTVEGLGQPDDLSPVQTAFWDEDALMCGFCTPGFVVSVSACLERDPSASEDEIRAACSGNVCRCGTYPHVFKAALAAGRKLGGGR